MKIHPKFMHDELTEAHQRRSTTVDYKILTGQQKTDQAEDPVAAPENHTGVEYGARVRLDVRSVDDRRVGSDNGHLLLLLRRNAVRSCVPIAVPGTWRRSVVGRCHRGRRTVRRVSLGRLVRCRSIQRRTGRRLFFLSLAMHVRVQLVLGIHLCAKLTEDRLIAVSASTKCYVHLR